MSTTDIVPTCVDSRSMTNRIVSLNYLKVSRFAFRGEFLLQ